MTAPTEDLIVRIETEVRAWESTRDDGSSGLAFEALLTEAAQSLRALQNRVEELKDALVEADLTIRSMPGTDQSHVEFIRSALTGSAQG